MTFLSRAIGATPGWRAAIVVCLLAVGATPLAAQEPAEPPAPDTPPPADTVGAPPPADPAPVPATPADSGTDTVEPGAAAAAATDSVVQEGGPPPAPTDSAADALPIDTIAAIRPPPETVRFPERDDAGWTTGVYVWDRTALLNSGALNVTELLERIPGVTPVRSSLQAMPQTVSSLGQGAGRMEVILDGYVLDPLGDASIDLARIELVQLESVRVERRMDALRVELVTLFPNDTRPYSMVEAGTGDFRTNLFRGLFLSPRVLGSPVAFGIERIQTDANYTPERASNVATWFKWGIGSSTRSLQVEMRRTSAERGASAPAPGKGARRDWVVRGRWRPIPAWTTELYYGRSRVEDYFEGAPPEPEPDPPSGDGEDTDGPTYREVYREVPPHVQTGGQAGLRTVFAANPLRLSAELRRRDHPLLPSMEADLGAGLDLAGWLFVEGDLTWARWRDVGNATTAAGRAWTRPVAGFSVTGEWSTGKRGTLPARYAFVPSDTLIDVVDEFRQDTTVVWTRPGVRLTDRTAWRAGIQFARWGIHLGAAVLSMQADSTATFGLTFDRTPYLQPAGVARGWELTASIPLLWQPLRFDATLARWPTNGEWLYLPVETMRASLTYHHQPLASGNLEIIARIEARRRGEMRVLGTDGMPAISPTLDQLDGFLQIRIMDVRAFIRWENILHDLTLSDVPGRTFPGQRVFYGVKWEFWN